MRCGRATGRRSVLVIAGGFPGEWEGEHPYDTVRRVGAEDVFFVGWRDHNELAEILRCSDVFAAPSVDEPFGLVYLEAMAAGLPPIATNTGGPASFINVDPGQPTGWLVPPDDVRRPRAPSPRRSPIRSSPRSGNRAAQFVASATRGPPRRQSSRSSTTSGRRTRPPATTARSEPQTMV